MILTREILPDLRRMYEEDCVPVIEIAGWLGVTRAAVYKFFRKHGISTEKGVATQRDVVCDGCGKGYKMNRARYRKQVIGNGSKKHFCSDVCYYAYLEDSGSLTNGHRQRIARMKVSEVFDLKPEHVVHHKDKNHFNMNLDNLMVFESQSDHLKYHHQQRQGEVTVVPIWDGGRIRPVEVIARGDMVTELSPREKFKLANPKKICPVCQKFNKDCRCG